MSDAAARDGLRHASLIIFDVNETLSDLAPLAARFQQVGAPEHLAKTWFAGVLRDGFSLTAVGVKPAFADLATDGLRAVLAAETLDRDLEDAVQHVMNGFAASSTHPDVPAGVRALAEGGFRLVTLSNGSASVAEALLDGAGIRDHFEALLSVDDAPLWKPAASAYRYALERCAVSPQEAVLVAVHPWDVDGAARAGLGTVWIDRASGRYPGYFEAPGLTVGSLTALADELTG